MELEPTARKIYRDLVKDSYVELARGEVTVTNVLTRLLRLSQLTGGFIGNDEGVAQKISDAKRSALEDIIETTLQEGKKLVVIARFVPELNDICKLLAKNEIKYSLIMGNFKYAKAHIYRVGQKNKCTYIFVIAKGTVDQKVLKALKCKADLAKTVVDDYRIGNNPFLT